MAAGNDAAMEVGGREGESLLQAMGALADAKVKAPPVADAVAGEKRGRPGPHALPAVWGKLFGAKGACGALHQQAVE